MIETMKEKAKLVEIKTTIATLHTIILDLSAGLWELNTKIDDMLIEKADHIAYMQDYDKFVDKVNDANMGEIVKANDERAVEMCNEMYQQEKEHPIILKSKGRPRKEVTPEPQESPVEPDVPETLPPLPPLPKAPETAHKPSIVERLLGKDADQKAKQRAEKMAQLEKELAEFSKK